MKLFCVFIVICAQAQVCIPTVMILHVCSLDLLLDESMSRRCTVFTDSIFISCKRWHCASNNVYYINVCIFAKLFYVIIITSLRAFVAMMFVWSCALSDGHHKSVVLASIKEIERE